MIKQRQPIFHAKTVTVVFIATNDIQRKYTFDRIKTDFLSLVKFIKKRLPTDALLVFTTLPQFPKYSSNPYVVNQIYHINQLIASVQTPNVTYIQWKFTREIEYYFERCYGNNVYRVDKLHLNRNGFELLCQTLRECINHRQETQVCK